MPQNLIGRASRRLLRWVLPLCSSHSREWGQAMLAELETIDKPVEALEWSLGCVGVVLRQALPALWSKILQATREWWCSGQEEGFPMRKAVAAAATAVGIAVLFFGIPSFRQGMRITASTSPLLEPGSYEYQAATVDSLRASAERDGDARMLAFVALHDPRSQIATQAADRAIAMEPQFTWIYYVLSRPDRHSPDAPRMVAALQHWDPANAVAYLAEAEQIRSTAPDSSAEITDNPAWVSVMERAFSASRYDTYANQHFELEKEIVFRRQTAGTPLQFVLAMGRHPLPNLKGIHDFSQNRLAAASRAKNVTKMRGLAAFDEHMLSVSSASEIERTIASSDAQRAYETLSPLVSDFERSAFEARIAELKRADKAANRERVLRVTMLSSLLPSPAVLHLCLVLLLLSTAGIASATAALILSPWKNRRITSTVLWVAAFVLTCGIYKLHVRNFTAFIHLAFIAVMIASISLLRSKDGYIGSIKKALWTSGLVMLLSCAAAYVAYLPYANLFREAMNAPSAAESMQLIDQAFVQFMILQGVTGTPIGPGFGFWTWVAVTILASASLLALGARTLLRGLEFPRAS